MPGFTSTSASAQYFGWNLNGALNCQPNTVSEATLYNVAGPGDRYHIRVRQTSDDASLGHMSMSSPHIDHASIGCGDVGKNFAGARNAITASFVNAGYGTTTYLWGNDAAIQQCDGSWAAGDGYVTYIHI